MKVALIGAGFVGTAVLKELARRGHEVKVLVRHPEKVTVTDPKITAVKTDVFNDAELKAQLKGADAVISAYNAGWTNPDIYPEFMKGAEAILHGVKKAGIKRLLIVGGAGSLYLPDGTQIVDDPAFPEAWKAGAQAARDFLNEIRHEQELDWTFLSPAVEMHQGTSGERKGTYRTGLDHPVYNQEGRSFISVEDLSVALADELEYPQQIRRRFTVAY